MGLDNPLHIAFLLLLLLLVFGAKRLPEMGRSLGEGLRGFKGSLNGEAMSSGVASQVATPAPHVATSAPQVVTPAAEQAPDPQAPAPIPQAQEPR
jgi:sec-independent protein translocase protein TatA